MYLFKHHMFITFINQTKFFNKTFRYHTNRKFCYLLNFCMFSKFKKCCLEQEVFHRTNSLVGISINLYLALSYSRRNLKPLFTKQRQLTQKRTHSFIYSETTCQRVYILLFTVSCLRYIWKIIVEFPFSELLCQSRVRLSDTLWFEADSNG